MTPEPMAPLLERPARIGDIISWNMGIAAVILALTVCPLGPGFLARFQRMFDALGGKLPALTVLYLTFPRLIFYGAAVAVICAVYYALVMQEHQGRKVMICFGACTTVCGVILLGVAATFYPILELQSAIRGGG
jgi:hypothetical protein